MTAINNATNNIVRMVAKDTTIPSLGAEQVSTKFIATIASVKIRRHHLTVTATLFGSNRQLDGHTARGD